MIVEHTINAFGDLVGDYIDQLGNLAPRDVLLARDLGPGDGPLSPQAIPPNPKAACIVAVIDHTIPFAHHLLTCASGHSRVAGIWLQGAPTVSPAPHIPFGQHLTGQQIDYLRGLDGGPVRRSAEELYRWLGLIAPAHASGRWFMRQYSHGAAVAGTATGYAPEDARGLAHPLIGVGLPDWGLADTSGAATPLLIQAGVTYIIAQARSLSWLLSHGAGQPIRLPLVVNISLGITAGPRDGSSLIERLQDELSRNPPPGLGPVHFVLSAGNSRQEMLNAVLTPRAKAEPAPVPPPDRPAEVKDEIGWQLLPDDRTLSSLEIWSAPHPPGQDAISIMLTAPDGRSVTSNFDPPKPGRGQIAYIRDDHGYEVARLYLQGWGEEADAVMRQVLTAIMPPSVMLLPDVTSAIAGKWMLQLLSAPTGSCDVVVQRDDRLPGFPPSGRQSYLVDPGYQIWLPNGQWPGPDPVPPEAMIRRDGTCSAYAWGREQIRCGAALGPFSENPTRIAPYSSLLKGGAAGDLVATGDRGRARRGVLAPGMTPAAISLISGTSIATPRLTRWLAEEMATLPVAERPQTRDEVITLARAARPGWSDPPRVNPEMPWDIRE